MADAFLETFAGVVRDQNCSTSPCLGNPIGTLEGRPVCAKHFDRRARLMDSSALESAIDDETDPFLTRRLQRALADVREWEDN